MERSRTPRQTAAYCGRCSEWGHPERAHHDPIVARHVAAQCQAEGRAADFGVWTAIADLLEVISDDERRIGVAAFTPDD